MEKIIGAKNVKLLKKGAKKDGDDYGIELDLSNMNLTADDCKLLAPAIEKIEDGEGCRKLDLSFNQIGDDGCKNLESVLRHQKGLHTRFKQINLHSNKITAEGCKYIAIPEMEVGTLNMSDNNIGDKGVERIVKNGEKEDFEFSGDWQIGRTGLELILNNVGMTDNGFKWLKIDNYVFDDCSDAIGVEVANNKLTDKSKDVLLLLNKGDCGAIPINISGNQFSKEVVKEVLRDWWQSNEMFETRDHFKCDYKFEDS